MSPKRTDSDYESFLNEGIYSPGHSPGSDNVDSFTQLSDGTLLIEIWGPLSGTDYDVINVANLASLDGALAIDLLDTYTPHPRTDLHLHDLRVCDG